MPPKKRQRVTPKFTKISSDEEAADKKSSNSPYGKVESHSFF